MNIMQAAKHLGVSDKTIRRAIHAGLLRARYPQHNRAEIDVSDVEQWYATTTHQSDTRRDTGASSSSGETRTSPQ